MDQTENQSELTFEQAMKRLQAITEQIQKSDCTLDEGLKLYEEGIRLSRYCNEKLSAFSQQLEQLNQQEDQDDQG